MKERIIELTMDRWDGEIEPTAAQDAVRALEEGKVIYLPKLNFPLENTEQVLLSGAVNPKGAKNISYNPKDQKLSGLMEPEYSEIILGVMQRYHQFSNQLLNAICPNYRALEAGGRTSFRPVEIKDRKAPSYRKDDTRLHVDAFPSTPTNDHRILRVFTNINPHGEDRFWKLGEPFAEVIQKFLPKVRRMWPWEGEILHRLKITRRKRWLYDHIMLQIHDMMKGDESYQRTVRADSLNFPPGSSWIVYTDLASHAALAGRFVLEQTYYPSVENMLDPSLSPQRQIENLRSRFAN